jgi:hypothetical protein
VKLNANGVCDPCSKLDSTIFALPPSLRKVKDDAKAKAHAAAEPVSPILHMVLVGGLTAGLFGGAAYLYSRWRMRGS